MSRKDIPTIEVTCDMPGCDKSETITLRKGHNGQDSLGWYTFEFDINSILANGELKSCTFNQMLEQTYCGECIEDVRAKLTGIGINPDYMRVR